MNIDNNGNPEFIQTSRGMRRNPNYNPSAAKNTIDANGLLKDLGSNKTPSQSITLTSGKDDGAIDVVRKDSINAAAPGGNAFAPYLPSGTETDTSTQLGMLNEQYGDDFTKDEAVENLFNSAAYNSPFNEYQPPQEKVTMYHPSGTTIQVLPNEVPLFEGNGYSTTQNTAPVAPPPAPVAPVAPVAPGNVPGADGWTDPNTGITYDASGLPINPGAEALGDNIVTGHPDVVGGPNVDPNAVAGPNIAIPDEDAPVGSPEHDAALNSPGNFEEPADQTVGPKGNQKYILDENKGWTKNPLYSINEDDQSTSAGVGDAATSSGLTDEEIEANLEAEFDRASGENDNQDGEIAAEIAAEIDAIAESDGTSEDKQGLMDGLLDSTKGLFKDGELAKALLLYAGSRIAGFSHGGSAKFAYEGTDLFGEDSGRSDETQQAFNSLDLAVENGTITAEQAKAKKQQLLLGGGAAEYSSNPQVRLTADGRMVTRSKDGKWRYDDGSVVPPGAKTRPAPSAAVLERANKKRNTQITENEVAMGINQAAIDRLNPDDFGIFDGGIMGKGLEWFRKQAGITSEVDFQRYFVKGAQNATSLRGKAAGALSNQEWEILLDATPGSFTDPVFIKQYYAAQNKLMGAQNEYFGLVNDFVSYGNTANEAKTLAKAEMNRLYPTGTAGSTGTGDAGDGSTITSDYLLT